jgi:hypothetical protein
MGNYYTKMGALKVVDPTAWQKEIKKAMKNSKGRVKAAAESLGVSDRQLFRWLADPVFTNVVRAPIGEPLHGRRGEPRRVDGD